MPHTKRAISLHRSTLIIVISSVFMATGFGFFATSLVQQETLTEAITVYKIKLWVHDSAPEGLGWGAISLRNTGDVETVIDAITIRGSEIPYSNWYVDSTVSEIVLHQRLNHTGWSGSNGMIANYDPDSLCSDTFKIDLDGAGGELPLCTSASLSSASITPGKNVVIYFKMINGTITVLDSGINVGVRMSAGKIDVVTSIIIQIP